MLAQRSGAVRTAAAPQLQPLRTHRPVPVLSKQPIRRRRLDASTLPTAEPDQASWVRRTATVDPPVAQLPQANLLDAAEAESATAEYPWMSQWYPVAVVDELDEKRPHQITLFGEDYVLWKDGSGAWRMFADRCPHRLAPLSEGRVESDGTLLCAYHAWRFAGDGACTALPQAPAGRATEVATRHPRACATAYPTRVEQGLVWVWPEAGQRAELQSAMTPPNLMPELLDPSRDDVKATEWRSTTLPYGFDYFLENVVDPAHVVVSHHNIVGNRYTDPKPIDLDITQPLDRLKGFRGTTHNADGRVSHTTFHPPNLVRIESALPDGATTVLMLHCVPTTPGFCKHIGRQVFIRGKDGKLSAGLGFFGWDLPVWLRHLLAPLFLHQDGVFLHWQERIMAQPRFRGTRASKAYYCPTTADKMVLLLRTWFEKFSPKGLPFQGEFEGAATPPAIRKPDELFDTWHSHTKNCKICLGALKNIERIRAAAWVACALSLVQVAVVSASAVSAKAAALVAGGAATDVAVAAAVTTVPQGTALAWAVGAAIAAGVALAMTRLIGMFYTLPFSHADNN